MDPNQIQPPAPPMMPPEAPAEEMASPEQMQQLRDLIEASRGKLGEVNAMKFAGSNKEEQTRLDSLKQIFAALQSVGVDITNPEAIAQFLEKLRATNPDMASLFEQAMESLLGDSAMNEAPEVEAPMPAPAENETLPQGI